MDRAGVDLRRVLDREEVGTLSSADQVVFLSTFRRLEDESPELAAVEAEIARRVQGVPEVQPLLSIPTVRPQPGVNGIVAAPIDAPLGDPKRVRRPQPVTGLSGSIRRSSMMPATSGRSIAGR